MKTVLIASIVAAIIVFVYQAMSWMVLPIHENTMKYTAQQDAILSTLSENLPEDGVYAIPNVPPGSTQEEHEKFNESMVGKPWALVHYHQTYSDAMAAQMAYGFIINFVAALVLAYVMWSTREKLNGFGGRMALVLAFVAFTLLQSSLLMANWWNTPWHFLSGEITDHILGWLLGGVWLAWFIGKKQTATS
ncbi:MAG: hypothetical protein ACKVRP_00510 [Bacteroidota bacterium]